MTAVFLGDSAGGDLALFAGLEGDFALVVLEVHLAVEEGESGFAVIGDGEIELGAANGPGNQRCAEALVAGALPALEIHGASLERGNGSFRGAGWFLDEEGGGRDEPLTHAVGKLDRGAAACAGAEAVAGEELQAGRGGCPLLGPGAHVFHGAFDGDEDGGAGVVGWSCCGGRGT